MKFSHPENDFFLVVDDHCDSFWTYLMNKNNEIIADCWLANKIDIPERESNFYKEKKIPPPAKKNI